MKQSTTFAQVATNQFDYLSSALCANTPPCKKHSSSHKFLTLSISLRLLLVLFLTLTVTTSAWGETVTDEITASDLKATTTTYVVFSNVTKSSDAIYAGQSAKDNKGNIQLRSKNSNSGVVSTASGGKVKSVKITVGSGSNTVDVYGSNTPYTSASDLYGANKGTKIGSLTATGTISFEGDYTYVGIRSNDGAIYLSSIDIVWEVAPTCTAPTISWATAPANGNIGGTMTAKANTNYPAGLTYSSSNPSVATIDASGVIEYLKVGSTTITASVTGDGTTYCDKTVKVTKTINVTCGSKVTINTTNDGNGSITANPTSIETCSDNDGNRQITITLNPNSHYSSNAPTISGITNATITGSGNTYTVQLPKSSNGTLNISATFKEDEKYTVTWMVDKVELSTEDVYENGKVSSVPTVTELPCGDKFVGWTTDPITTPQNKAPEVFTTVVGSPNITEPTTFYAVFADYDNE